jgi:hypothetical protein
VGRIYRLFFWVIYDKTILEQNRLYPFFFSVNMALIMSSLNQLKHFSTTSFTFVSIFGNEMGWSHVLVFSFMQELSSSNGLMFYGNKGDNYFFYNWISSIVTLAYFL